MFKWLRILFALSVVSGALGIGYIGYRLLGPKQLAVKCSQTIYEATCNLEVPNDVWVKVDSEHGYVTGSNVDAEEIGRFWSIASTQDFTLQVRFTNGTLKVVDENDKVLSTYIHGLGAPPPNPLCPSRAEMENMVEDTDTDLYDSSPNNCVLRSKYSGTWDNRPSHFCPDQFICVTWETRSPGDTHVYQGGNGQRVIGYSVAWIYLPAFAGKDKSYICDLFSQAVRQDNPYSRHFYRNSPGWPECVR